MLCRSSHLSRELMRRSTRTVAAEERLNTARRNSAISVRDAQRAHDALKSSQDGLKGSTSGLAGTLEGLGGKLSTFGVVAGGAALAGVTALAAGVLVVGNRLYEMGQQFDDTFDNIRIKTGATGPQLEALQKATERLSTKVPLSIGEIGNVVAETSRALHLTGPELDNVAKSIANLGRLTGEPVNVRELGKAFRGFGVDAKDQVPALDSLLRASQKTGVSVNELLATVVKGGAGLRQFGFDFGESAALVTQFEEAGLDSNRAMTGLTKGLAGLAKDGQTGEQALRGTVSEIKNLISSGNDAGALDLTNKLFGAKGGVQFFEAIKNGALDLDTLADSLNNTGDTINQAAQDTDDWSERWQTLKNTAAVALEPLATGLFDQVNESLGGFADWVETHQPEVIGFFERFGEVAITAAENVAHGAGGMLQAIGDLAGGIGNVKGVLDSTMAFFADLRGDHAGAEEFRRSAQEAFGWGESIRAMGDKLANLNLDDARAKVHGWADAAAEAATNAQSANDHVTGLGTALGALPFQHHIQIDADLEKAKSDVKAFIDSLAAGPGVRIPIAAAPPGYNPLLPAGPATPAHGGGRAFGGPIFGPGGPTSDQVPIMASHGEHMWTAREVNDVGGQANMYRLRALARKGAFRHFSGGGMVPLRDPRGVDPGGSKDGGRSLGPFAPWWDMDWMPPEHPEKVSPSIPGVDGKWWHHGPVGKDKITGGGTHPWAPPIGKYRPPLPGDPYPGMLPDWEIKGFKDGGEVNADWFSSVVGTPYQMGGFGNTFDCSGAVSAGVNVLMGRPWNKGPQGGSARMATGSEAEWLQSQGFVMGVGPPGSIRVGWVNGGPGGGHTAMTLPDGRNFEAGSGRGVTLGGPARGADDPEFTQHAYLPAGPQANPNQGSPASQSPSSSGSSSSSSSGGKGGGSTNSLSDLVGGAVKIGIDGLMETIGADGSFLPENLGIPKTLMAALGLKFKTPAGSFSLSEGFQPAVNGTPGEGGGGTSFSPFGMQTTMPQIGTPASGVGTGPAPGPVDQSTNIHINNPQGDPAEIEKRTRTALKTTPRLDSHMPAGF
jgi:TP901 family phage tail tape measure protein